MQKPIGIFKDPMNPTRTELKIWAYGDYSDPVPDFQLFVIKDPYMALELASDVRCPRREFFLESLYVWIGDQVRLGLPDRDLVLEVIKSAEELPSERIKKFVERSRDLILRPELYNSNDWGIGGTYGNE